MMSINRPTSLDLIATALRHHTEILQDVRIDDLADEEDVVLRRLGYRLIGSGDRMAFERGRRMLERPANGRIFPPPHKRWWPGPSKHAADLAAVLHPYTIELVWRGGKSRWELGGRLWLHGIDKDWRWYPLLHVDEVGEWARTSTFWIQLGRRMIHAV